MLKTVVLLNILCKLWHTLFFRIHRWTESSKEQHLFEVESLCNIVNVFNITFNQFNASLMNEGHCKRSPKCPHACFRFFVFVILSYQNACYGCKIAENQTWSDFFSTDESFGGKCANVIDTIWGRINFFTCENFRRKCSMTLKHVFFLKLNLIISQKERESSDRCHKPQTNHVIRVILV